MQWAWSHARVLCDVQLALVRVAAVGQPQLLYVTLSFCQYKLASAFLV